MITITESAAQAIRDAFRSEGLDPERVYLRLGVRAGGCAGFSYVLGFDENRRDQDEVVPFEGFRVLMDPASKALLAGITLDYTSGLAGRGFVFHNPNATGNCGCGSSFSA